VKVEFGDGDGEGDGEGEGEGDGEGPSKINVQPASRNVGFSCSPRGRKPLVSREF
jgi:hypothetical protein